MKNQTMIGIAAGAAALAIAGIMLAKKSGACGNDNSAIADNFKGKLGSLQRKAKKEFKNISADLGENPAKDRVNQWVNNPSL